MATLNFRGFGWNYLSFRLWIGLWIGLVLVLLVATDASAFVCYITRFTEENFATLIAFIFIQKAFVKVAHIGDEFPIHPTACYCIPKNKTLLHEFGHSLDNDFVVVEKNSTHRHQYFCQVGMLFRG